MRQNERKGKVKRQDKRRVAKPNRETVCVWLECSSFLYDDFAPLFVTPINLHKCQFIKWIRFKLIVIVIHGTNIWKCVYNFIVYYYIRRQFEMGKLSLCRTLKMSEHLLPPAHRCPGTIANKFHIPSTNVFTGSGQFFRKTSKNRAAVLWMSPTTDVSCIAFCVLHCLHCCPYVCACRVYDGTMAHRNHIDSPVFYFVVCAPFVLFMLSDSHTHAIGYWSTAEHYAYALSSAAQLIFACFVFFRTRPVYGRSQAAYAKKSKAEKMPCFPPGRVENTHKKHENVIEIREHHV